MQSSPVSKSESRVNSNFSTILDAKNRVQEQLGVTGKGGYREKEGLGTQDLEANTELRH